jgi:DNA-binding NtrC family response regulator
VPTTRTLLVHAEPTVRERLARLCWAEGHQVRVIANLAEAARAIAQERPDLVVAGDAEAGSALVEACRAVAPEAVLVVVPGGSEAGPLEEAIQRGAERLRRLRAEPAPAAPPPSAAPASGAPSASGRPETAALASVLGRSPAMLEVLRAAGRIAASAAPVLLRGEPGTGRELLARAIHAASARASGPFVVVDCAALPERTLEQELFGGAAPTAASAPAALLAQARGGSLYLHEIMGAGPGVSARILRVLAEGALRAGEAGEPVDVRVMGSTREDLHALAREGRVQAELAARLDVVTLRLPPLRERAEDVPLLAEHFAAKHGRAGAAIAPEALDLLRAYRWPDNVRELEYAIARALALTSGAAVLAANLPAVVQDDYRPPVTGRPGERPTLHEVERRYAEEILRETGGNKSRTAEVLGIDRKTLYRLLGLTPAAADRASGR